MRESCFIWPRSLMSVMEQKEYNVDYMKSNYLIYQQKMTRMEVTEGMFKILKEQIGGS